MLNKFGKTVEGGDPIWPDGSSMRFLPIKGPAIKNEKTRSIVRKRLAYHIWLKANEASIDTNFTNIYNTQHIRKLSQKKTTVVQVSVLSHRSPTCYRKKNWKYEGTLFAYG
jgi:hypothetical protein